MEIEWSRYQKRIFEEKEKGERNLLIKASAGSGKTKSLIESIKYFNQKEKWFLTSFGNKIVDELKNKAPEGGEIKTLHSFGLKCLYKTFGSDIVVDNDKVYTLIDKTIGKKLKNRELPYQLSQAVEKCKLSLALTKDDVKDTISRFEIDILDLPEEEFVNHVIFLMNLCKKFTNVVDYTDMVWLHNVLTTNVQQFDRVLIDEFQDFSRCEVNFIFRIPKKDGKCYAYGDPFQGIYYWKSADPESFNRFISKFDPLILPLPISYRCPIKVIELAKQYNPDIEAWEKAIDGSVKTISIIDMFKKVEPGCFILSRYNAPIVSIAMKLLAQRKPCNIQGRDLGENLVNIIKRSRTKTIEKFLIWLEKWKKKESAKIIAMKKDPSKIVDTYQCLITFAQNCSSLEQMKNSINKLFYDGNEYDKIILSSIHRAKGLERNDVFILKSTLRSHNQEEKNIVYTGITRSMKNLYFVESEKKKAKNDKDSEIPLNEQFLPDPLSLIQFDDTKNNLSDSDMEIIFRMNRMENDGPDYDEPI